MNLNVSLIRLKSDPTGLAEIVEQQSGQDERQVNGTLQELLKRDLIVKGKDDRYEIVAPIFRAWIERSLYN